MNTLDDSLAIDASRISPLEDYEASRFTVEILVGPRPSFGETLVSFGGFGPLLDFDTLVEVGHWLWISPILRVMWSQ
jgi:hypothetical protein